MTMPQLCDHDEPCGCYAEGYAAGKDEARCELRHHSDSQHPTTETTASIPGQGPGVAGGAL